MATRSIYKNPGAKSWKSNTTVDSTVIESFFNQLSGYEPTSIIPLDEVAKEIGVKKVYVKNETDRFGLPAFKILGASWSTFRALTKQLNLSLDSDFETVSTRAKARGIKLFAATDGNHGRAVAKMATKFGINSTIYTPNDLTKQVRDNISNEGAEVIVVNGNYDDAVDAARKAADNIENGILIQDMSFDDYQEIPQWIVDGYSVLMMEIDKQIHESVDVVVVPVGVGSLAQAVVGHSKSRHKSYRILTIEPSVAASLLTSLEAGKIVPISTSFTIMNGLNCGTISSAAWPILKSGVDASTTVDDIESHEAIKYLQYNGVNAGPCGAAPLAGLKYVAINEPECLGLNKDSVIVLLCTEGYRDYPIPK